MEIVIWRQINQSNLNDAEKKCTCINVNIPKTDHYNEKSIYWTGSKIGKHANNY